VNPGLAKIVGVWESWCSSRCAHNVLWNGQALPHYVGQGTSERECNSEKAITTRHKLGYGIFSTTLELCTLAMGIFHYLGSISASFWNIYSS
jgi:hypothetical protein